MANSPAFYINHIKESIGKILSYTEEMDEDSFYENDLVQDAVIRHLEIIGEATKRIDKDFRIKNPIAGYGWNERYLNSRLFKC